MPAAVGGDGGGSSSSVGGSRRSSVGGAMVISASSGVAGVRGGAIHGALPRARRGTGLSRASRGGDSRETPVRRIYCFLNCVFFLHLFLLPPPSVSRPLSMWISHFSLYTWQALSTHYHTDHDLILSLVFMR